VSRPGGSLGLKVALAVELTLFFYVFAIGLAGLLCAIPYLEWHYAGMLHYILLACPVAALLILASLLPRRDVFLAPGRPLASADQPALFRLLEAVAGELGEAMPDAVYLTARVGVSFSTHQGKRVLEIGLPLLGALSVADARAVIAQGFACFRAGDMRLGPWIATTREKIARSQEQLGGPAIFHLIGLLFRLYGAVFLRLTASIAREQEFLADEAAARLVGPRTLASALEKTAAASVALPRFTKGELAPVLRAGLRPPLMAGFGRFLARESAARPTPEATGPLLAERLDALAALGGPEPAMDERRAISLLSGLEDLERLLLPRLVDGEIGRLEPVAWAELGSRFHLPRWETTVRENAAVLAGLTPLSFIGADLEELGKRFGKGGAKIVDPKAARRAVLPVAGAALAVALAKQGFEVQVSPGEPLTLVRGDRRIDPFALVREWERGPAADGKALCEAAGIAALDLGTLVPPAAPANLPAPLVKRGKKEKP
jgi:Zn-dependent protease with chaperone function